VLWTKNTCLIITEETADIIAASSMCREEKRVYMKRKNKVLLSLLLLLGIIVFSACNYHSIQLCTISQNGAMI